jgi:DUF4097 and DUF4098 domain-containing protein YvlB
MKTLHIIIIAIAASLVLVATALLILQLSGVSWWSKLQHSDPSKIQAQTKTISPSGLHQITVDVNNDQLQIKPAHDDQITVDYYTSEHTEFKIDANNGELAIRQQHRDNITPNMSSSVPPPVVVHVPASSQFAYNLHTSNGRIEAADIAADQLRADTSNADISLHRLQIANNLVANTANGSIAFDQLAAGDIDLKTSNANIGGTLIGRSDDYRKDLQTSPHSGLTIDGTAYHQEFKSDRGTKTLRAHTNNGNINLNFVK